MNSGEKPGERATPISSMKTAPLVFLYYRPGGRTGRSGAGVFIKFCEPDTQTSLGGSNQLQNGGNGYIWL